MPLINYLAAIQRANRPEHEQILCELLTENQYVYKHKFVLQQHIFDFLIPTKKVFINIEKPLDSSQTTYLNLIGRLKELGFKVIGLQRWFIDEDVLEELDQLSECKLLETWDLLEEIEPRFRRAQRKWELLQQAESSALVANLEEAEEEPIVHSLQQVRGRKNMDIDAINSRVMPRIRAEQDEYRRRVAG